MELCDAAGVAPEDVYRPTSQLPRASGTVEDRGRLSAQVSVGGSYGDLRGTTGAATTAACGEGAERALHEEQARGQSEARGREEFGGSEGPVCGAAVAG